MRGDLVPGGNRAVVDRRRTVRRRRVTAVVVLLLVAAGMATVALLPRERSAAVPRPSLVSLTVPGKGKVVLSERHARRIASGRAPLPVPAYRTRTVGQATITYRLDRSAVRQDMAAAVAGDGGEVDVAEQPVAAQIDAPVVKQIFPNNCETAALKMLLASRGVEQSQKFLQAKLHRDGPLDPTTGTDGGKVWGDPDRGFVGRVRGGGLAGGYGVYPRPLMALAHRWVDPVDLTRARPAAIYRRLLSGHAVLAWIGLTDGPYESWRGPRGEKVTVNWGEHTVLLRGLRDGILSVNDPLIGERVEWTKQEFVEKWSLLGRRAISA
ncbi:MAG: C39 family peptidase [Actinobacteria bacterium]|nr:C39 family peptidase [Actinomycetota bacterium]